MEVPQRSVDPGLPSVEVVVNLLSPAAAHPEPSGGVIRAAGQVRRGAVAIDPLGELDRRLELLLARRPGASPQLIDGVDVPALQPVPKFEHVLLDSCKLAPGGFATAPLEPREEEIAQERLKFAVELLRPWALVLAKRRLALERAPETLDLLLALSTGVRAEEPVEPEFEVARM